MKTKYPLEEKKRKEKREDLHLEKKEAKKVGEERRK